MRRNAEYWKHKEENSVKAIKHTEEMEKQYGEEIEAAVKNSIIWTKTADGTLIKEVNGVETSVNLWDVHRDSNNNPSYRVSKMTTQDAITNSMRIRPVVLNFASYKNPGGGFIKGSSAQEESLCHDSFLYNALSKLMSYYEWNREHLNKGLYTDRAIYTPGVYFFNKDGSITETDVITCAAPNRSLLLRYESFTEEENTEVLTKRCEFLSEIAYLSRPDAEEIILGAWGCGVFRQSSTEVGELLLKDFSNLPYKVITFAIPDNGNMEKFMKAFNGVTK